MKKEETEKKEQILEEVQNLGDQIKNLGTEAKKRYEDSDRKTKMKIISALAGGVTLLTAFFQSKRIKNLKKKLKEEKENK